MQQKWEDVHLKIKKMGKRFILMMANRVKLGIGEGIIIIYLIPTKQTGTTNLLTAKEMLVENTETHNIYFRLKELPGKSGIKYSEKQLYQKIDTFLKKNLF